MESQNIYLYPLITLCSSDFSVCLTTSNTTTMPYLTVMLAATWTVFTTVMIASTLVALPGVPNQQDELLPSLLIPMDIMRTVADFAAQLHQQPQAQMGPQDSMHLGLCLLCQRSLTGKFFPFRVEPPSDLLCWCYGVCFLVSGSNVVTVYTNGDSTHLDFHYTVLQNIHMECIFAS